MLLTWWINEPIRYLRVQGIGRFSRAGFTFFYLDEQNVVAVQYQGKIFYRVSREIKDGKEFLTYYGDSYFEEMGGSPHQFHSNLPNQVEDELVSYLIN